MTPDYRVSVPPFVYLRTPQWSLEELSDIFGADDPVVLARSIFAGRPSFRTALAIASPVLFRLFERENGARVDRRAALRALAYAIRIASRCTPFGTFALVGEAAVGPETTITFDPARMATRTRIDMAYFETYAQALEAEPARRDALEVVASDAVIERGARLHIIHARRTSQSATTAGGWDHTAISVRSTPAVEFVRSFASTPRRMRDIASAVSREFEIDEARGCRLVETLYEAGLLLSTIRPYPVSSGCGPIVHPALESDFAAATHAAAMFDAAEDFRSPEMLAKTVAALPVPPEGDQLPLQIDAARRFMGTLGNVVLRDVEEFARICTHGAVFDLLRDYAQSFVARYEGFERVVPLLELTDPQLGLGAPPISAPADADYASSEQHAALLALLATSLRNGDREIAMQKEDLARYIGSELPESALSSAIEMSVVISAPDTEALDRGEYLIGRGSGLVTDAAARTYGRFADMLGDEMLARGRALVRRAAPAGCIEAELVYATPFARTVNVTQRPRMVDWEVVAGFPTSSNAQRLPMNDLVVGLTSEGFAVYSRSLSKRIVIRETHAMNTPEIAPGPIRFLSLLARKPSMMHGGFRWYRLSSAPYLPRVRCERLVLSPEQWNVPVATIRDDARLSQWLARWGAGPRVVLCVGDNRLALDLSTTVGREVLRDQTVRQGITEARLQEPLGVTEPSWLRAEGKSYAVEVMFTLEAAQPPRRAPSVPGLVVGAGARLRAPLSDWVYLKCYVPRDRADEIVGRVVAPTIAEAEARLGPLPWFFVRYGDPRFHVRIRVACGEHGAEVTALLAHAMRSLLEEGELDRFLFDTYEREVERYGGLEAMEAVENVFCASSRFAAMALADGSASSLRRRELAVAAAYTFLRTALDADTLEQWFGRSSHSRVRLDEQSREALRRLRADVLSNGIPDDARARVNAEFGCLVRADSLSSPLAAVVDSIVHMEFNRFGVENQLEPLANRMLAQLYASVNAAHPRRFDGLPITGNGLAG